MQAAMPGTYCARIRYAMHTLYVIIMIIIKTMTMIVMVIVILILMPINLLLTWYGTCISLLEMSALVSVFWQDNSSSLLAS